MPVLTQKLTDEVARNIEVPASGYVIYGCPKTPGFALRVTSTGARAWIFDRRVDGEKVRRTLGKAPGGGAGTREGGAVITADAARKLQITISSDLQQGKDPLEATRERRLAAKVEAVTFDRALKAYVKGKRRAKDGLPLKQRTVEDYEAMLAAPIAKKQAGELHALASKPLHRITARDITALHKDLEARGERRQTYAMQVLRAVLRHHGVVVDGNPLDPRTPGKDRVKLAPSRGDPSPIPPERLGAWWRAASKLATDSADQLKFMLLTGCRPGEAAGLLVKDLDIVGKRAVLRDTKNRSDHTLVLSTQAAAIAHWHTQGKKLKDPVFGVADTGKTIAAINAAASTPGVTPHKLRHTFASVASELVPVFALRRMLNHAAGADVAAAHYVGVSEPQLRAGWQAVADYIEAAK
jgi:integrase